MPVCSKCHFDKPITEFTSNKSRPTGYNPACKACDAPAVYKRQFEERGGPMTDDKRCAGCKLIKSYTEFRTQLNTKDGLTSRCQSCERMRDKQNYYLKKGVHHKHRDPMHIRFWRNVDTSGGPEACWPWKGQLNDGGYGVYARNQKTHRLAWKLTFGDIPKDMQVLHDCPNGDLPSCCNVFAHLWLGTQRENMQDAAAKGRMSALRGSNNPPQVHAERNRLHRWTKETTWEERFWVKVLRSDVPDSCWLWTANLTDGYGTFRLDGKIQKAHILSYRIAYGDYDPSLQVRHICDQRACVNPQHLLAGPKIDNLWDMIDKGRHTHVIPREKLPYIRSQKGFQSSSALAKEFGVTRSAISAIWNNRTGIPRKKP